MTESSFTVGAARPRDCILDQLTWPTCTHDPPHTDRTHTPTHTQANQGQHAAARACISLPLEEELNLFSDRARKADVTESSFTVGAARPRRRSARRLADLHARSAAHGPHTHTYTHTEASQGRHDAARACISLPLEEKRNVFSDRAGQTDVTESSFTVGAARPRHCTVDQLTWPTCTHDPPHTDRTHTGQSRSARRCSSMHQSAARGGTESLL